MLHTLVIERDIDADGNASRICGFTFEVITSPNGKVVVHVRKYNDLSLDDRTHVGDFAADTARLMWRDYLGRGYHQVSDEESADLEAEREASAIAEARERQATGEDAA